MEQNGSAQTPGPDSRMPGLIAGLLQKDGDKLTYLLAINGNYFGAGPGPR